MGTLMQDVRYGLRMLIKNPGFTITAVLCLTLGIGATTGIFSVVNSVLLRPLPYGHPEQLVRVYSEFPAFPNGGLRRFWVSAPEFLNLRRDTRSWQTLDAWVTGGANLAGRMQPVRLTAAFVSGEMLSTLGVAPAAGRLISPSDDTPSAPSVADISYGVWKSVYGGDPNIVGSETQLNGQKTTIIGVMPRGFEFPPGETDPPQVWSALGIDPAKPGNAGSHFLYLMGRLKAGVTLAQAQGELDSLVNASAAHRTMKTHTFSPKDHTLVSYRLQAEVVSSVRPALLMLLGAVCFVLLIACVNVANLLLARAEARRREMAIRGALGAGIGRLARQFATEGVLLSLPGAALGLLLAADGLLLLRGSSAGSIPRAAEIGLDWRVLLFTLGISLLTGLVFGLAPILPMLYENLSESLKDTAGGATAAAGAQFFRRVLVAGELGMALVLLIGCGLMVRAFWKLQQVHTGMQPRNVITMMIALPQATYTDSAKQDAFWTRLEDGLQQLPGAQFAALASGLPPVRPPNMNDTKIEGFVHVPGGPIENVDFYQGVTPSYFATMGIRLMAGRLFDERDGPSAPEVAIVNQTMARTFWPNQDPIGRRILPGGNKDWLTVVGVVEDVKNGGLDRPTGTEIYLPYLQPAGGGNNLMYVLLRGEGDSTLLTSDVRGALAALDPTVPLSKVRLMDDVLSGAQARPRFLTQLLALFSGVALAIAIVGIYGVISYSVARRAREFGLRMALGAQQRDVLRMVLWQGARLTLWGTAIGVIGALLLTRLMSGLLYGISATDPATFAGVALVLGMVAVAACYIPARRAMRTVPMDALRHEQ